MAMKSVKVDGSQLSALLTLFVTWHTLPWLLQTTAAKADKKFKGVDV